MTFLTDLADWAKALMPSRSSHSVNVSNSGVPISHITPGSGELWDAFTGGMSNGNMPHVTEASINTLTTVYACVNLRAGLIAAMPMKLMEVLPNGDEVEILNDPLLTILNRQFSPRWASHVGWDYMERSRCTHGDAFAEIVRQGGRIVGLIPHHPARVEVRPLSDGSRLAYQISPDPWITNRGIRILDQDDVVHVSSAGFDGCRSMSPLQYSLKMAGGVALAAQNYTGQFFANSSTPPIALTMEGNATEQTMANLRAEIETKYSARSGNIGRPMLLSGGLKVQPLALNNDDAALLQTRQFQVEELARAMQVPPFMIGHYDKATALPGGLVQMLLSFKKLQLQPNVIAYENELTRKLVRLPNRKIVVDTFALETGDIKTLLEALRIASGRAGEDAIMTINEVRRYMRLNRVDGGDVLKKGNADEKAKLPDEPVLSE